MSFYCNMFNNDFSQYSLEQAQNSYNSTTLNSNELSFSNDLVLEHNNICYAKDGKTYLREQAQRDLNLTNNDFISNLKLAFQNDAEAISNTFMHNISSGVSIEESVTQVINNFVLKEYDDK